MLFHPTDLRLGLFAEGELPPRTVRRVARHLQRCGRCRARVTATRKLSRDARDLAVPPLPTGLRERVMHALAAGEQVIVPVADPVRVWPWRQLAWVGAGVVLVVGGARLVLNRPLYSEASSLEFAPADPSVGAEVSVTYHASGLLAADTALVLRAVYRGAGDPAYSLIRRVAIPLARTSDRIYRARVQLPVNAVYAAFAVEDEAGDVVDFHGSMGWQLLVHANGLPTLDAFRQKTNEAMGRDRWEALKTADSATRLYPNRVEAWAFRSAAEILAYGSGAVDSLRDVHMPVLRALDQRLRRVPVSAYQMQLISVYASGWKGFPAADSVAAWWKERTLREAPRSAFAMTLRTIDITNSGEAPAEQLRQLDSLYDDGGAPQPNLLNAGFELAADSLRDANAALRWAQRLVAVDPRARVPGARQLLAFPSLRDTALAWIDLELDRLSAPDDSRRPLYESRQSYQLSLDSARFDLLGLKGQALLAMGDTVAARAYLDSSVAHGWDLPRFRAAITTRLAAADTVGAAEMLARVAVDPAADLVGADAAALNREAARRAGRRLVGDSAWETDLIRAHVDMMTETRREAGYHKLFDSVHVTLPGGDAIDLRDRLQGHVTVVAFFFPPCRSCVSWLAQLHDLVATLPGPPGLVIVSRRSPTPADSARLDDAGLASYLTLDAKDEAAQAFGLWGMEAIFVVDAEGMIQYRPETLDAVPRYVLSLPPTQNVVAGRAPAGPRAGLSDGR